MIFLTPFDWLLGALAGELLHLLLRLLHLVLQLFPHSWFEVLKGCREGDVRLAVSFIVYDNVKAF